MFISHTSGAWLDLKAADYSKKRKAAQKTQGLVTLSRTDAEGEAVKIEKGHVFKTALDINGEELRFFAVEGAVLQKGAWAVDVLVEAEKEGTRYNVPEGQITRSLTFVNGVDAITNGPNWITREGSDVEDDESLKTRVLRSWSELAARPIEDTFINAAESVPGVLFAQADCDHPRGQGTVDVIVTGTAGEATEGLLAAVREAVEKIAGPYDNILVKSSITVAQDIEVAVTTSDVDDDEEIKGRVASILTELLAVRKGRKFYELTIVQYRNDLNGGLDRAVNINEHGTFANDPDEGEILLYYANLGAYYEPVPARGENDPITSREYPVSIGVAEGVEVMLGYMTTAYMTAEDVEAYCDARAATSRRFKEGSSNVL